MIVKGCHLIVNHQFSLTSDKVPGSFTQQAMSPSFGGLPAPKREENMSGKTL